LDPNEEKEKARKKFVQTGRGRRQDHATRGNAVSKGQRWFDHGYFDKDEPKRLERCHLFRRGGMIEEE